MNIRKAVKLKKFSFAAFYMQREAESNGEGGLAGTAACEGRAAFKEQIRLELILYPI